MFPHHMVIYFDAVVLLGADLSAGTLHSHSKFPPCVEYHWIKGNIKNPPLVVSRKEGKGTLQTTLCINLTVYLNGAIP